METNRNNIDESVRFVARHYQKGVFDTSKGWEKLMVSLPDLGRKGFRLPLTWAVAAVVLLFVIGVGVLKIVNQPEQLIAENSNTTFTLPDQTGIVMQQGATLQYGKDFDKIDRRVSMHGEITFAVTRDETKPFIVSTPVAQIEVLGTEFTVTADDDETRLSVTSGKVKFTPDDPVIPLLCTAGMTVHYVAETQMVKVTSPDRQMEINGKTRSLTFDNMALNEIVMVLSNFYHVEIELPAEESELTFSSSFTQESIIEIVNIINLTLDTHITIIQP